MSFFWNEIPLESINKMTWLKIVQEGVLFNEWSFELFYCILIPAFYPYDFFCNTFVS